MTEQTDKLDDGTTPGPQDVETTSEPEEIEPTPESEQGRKTPGPEQGGLTLDTESVSEPEPEKFSMTQDTVFTYPFKVTVYKNIPAVDGDGKPILRGDGTQMTRAIDVEEWIEVPRMTTMHVIAYRDEMLAEFGDDPNTKIPLYRLGEIVAETLLPGIIEKLHPHSFDELKDEILRVEKKMLNPPQTEKLKGGKPPKS